MPLWDKVKQELDRAGQVAQDALDEGRIRLEAHRARQMADQAAEKLGYAVHRAQQAGGQLDSEELARHSARLGEHEAEVTRLEAQMATIQQRWRAGGGTTPGGSAGGPAGAAGAAGAESMAGAEGMTGAAGAGFGAAAAERADMGTPSPMPGGTPSVTTAMETPPEASGGPVPPPENTPPSMGTYGIVPPVPPVGGSAAETDKPTTDMWAKGEVMGHEPY